MKNNMLSEKDEVKNFRVKVMDKNNMNEMWTHINPSQVEKKFSGDAPDVPMSEHWPPKSPNSDFWCTPSQKNDNYITKQEYYEMYNKGKLIKSKICFDLVEETAIEKIKAAGDAGKISGLGAFKNKQKKNTGSEKNSDELNVKDINIDVIGSNYNGSHSEKGGVERVPSTTNLKDASAGVKAGPKLMPNGPMIPCRPDGEEPEFDDDASNMSSMVRINPAEDNDLMVLEGGPNKMEVIVEANENLNTPGLLQTPQNGRVSNSMGSPFLKPKRPSYVYENIDDFQLTMFANFQVLGKGV
jgi:hypothetical protein